MVMDESIQRIPNKSDWLNKPIASDEWQAKTTPPDKRYFVDWLEREVGITNYPTQYGLWQSIVFSSQWLIRDYNNRPLNSDLKERFDKILSSVADIQSVLKADANGRDIDDWTKFYLDSAEIKLDTGGALDSISRHLELLSALIANANTLVSKTGPGRPKDDTLWEWTEALSKYIELFTDIEMTVDFHDGEPTTPYSRIVHKVIEMLDPERLPKVPNVLRRMRTEQNRVENSND